MAHTVPVTPSWLEAEVDGTLETKKEQLYNMDYKNGQKTHFPVTAIISKRMWVGEGSDVLWILTLECWGPTLG